MARNRCSASRAPKDHHFVWVTAECFCVRLDPLQLQSYHGEYSQLLGSKLHVARGSAMILWAYRKLLIHDAKHWRGRLRGEESHHP